MLTGKPENCGNQCVLHWFSLFIDLSVFLSLVFIFFRMWSLIVQRSFVLMCWSMYILLAQTPSIIQIDWIVCLNEYSTLLPTRSTQELIRKIWNFYLDAGMPTEGDTLFCCVLVFTCRFNFNESLLFFVFESEWTVSKYNKIWKCYCVKLPASRFSNRKTWFLFFSPLN